MKKINFLTLLLILATTYVSAQKLSGDITRLKGQQEVNVVLDFSGMTVNNKPEEVYVNNQVKDKEGEEKELWREGWGDDV